MMVWKRYNFHVFNFMLLAEPVVIGYTPGIYMTDESAGLVVLTIVILSGGPVTWDFNVTVNTSSMTAGK